MSLTDCLSERRIWKDPRFLLCINCSVPLPVSLHLNKRKTRELGSTFVWWRGTLTEEEEGVDIKNLGHLKLDYSPESLTNTHWEFELPFYLYTVCGLNLVRCSFLAGPQAFLCASISSPCLFIPGCKLIFLRWVGSGTEGRVSVSGGVALAVCQPLAVNGPLYLGLGYSLMTAGQNPSTFNTPPARRGCARLAQATRF